MSVEKPDQPSTEALQAKVAELETLLAQAKSETGKESPAAVAALARAQEAIESGTASAGRIEQRIEEMRAVVEKDAASLGGDGPPRLIAGVGPGVRGGPIYGQLGQVPMSDRVFAEPGQHLPPCRVEPVLMAGHHDPSRLVRGGGDAERFLSRDGDRLLTEHVVAVFERPEGRCEVGRGRRADINELHRADRRERIAVG